MPHYRLYYLDLAGHIADAADLDCEDDEHALREVERRHDGRVLELWRRTVLLGRFLPLERRGLDPTTSGGRDAAEV